TPPISTRLFRPRSRRSSRSGWKTSSPAPSSRKLDEPNLNRLHDEDIMTRQPGLQAVPAAMPSDQKGMPRGLKMTGPVLLSYGFRPFFLGGAIWAVLAMLLWILSLTLGMPLGGSYGGLNWH